MAKRSSPQQAKTTLPDDIKIAMVDPSQLLGKTPLSTDAPIYSNYVQINANPQEFTLDFYEISPKPGGRDANMKHISRVFIPSGLAKGFVTAMANLVDKLEQDPKIKLLNSREDFPGDSIQIWK